MVQPFHIRINAVAGNTWRILHNGNALACQPVKECGFPHVWASYHCYNRFAHVCSSQQMISFLLHSLHGKGALQPHLRLIYYSIQKAGNSSLSGREALQIPLFQKQPFPPFCRWSHCSSPFLPVKKGRLSTFLPRKPAFSVYLFALYQCHHARHDSSLFPHFPMRIKPLGVAHRTKPGNFNILHATICHKPTVCFP